MLGLPKTTEISKQLPKKAIYAKFNMNTAAKDKFDADISRITIVNEISPATTNIAAGEEVSAFYVLRVTLKTESYDNKTVSMLPKLIEQKMIFVLEYETKSKLAVFRSGQLIQSDWKNTDECSVLLNGLNLDTVWENLVVQIGGITVEKGNSVDEQIELNKKREQIEKEIARLEKQARKETQPKKKFELVQKIQKLKESENK